LPIFGVFIAFKQINYADGIWGSPWVGFDNFSILFSSNSLWRITRNTVGYSLVFMVVNMAISIGIAIGISEIRNRAFAKAYQTSMLMPNFLSMIIVSYLVYAFLHPTQGFMNASVLQGLGMDPVNWYMEKSYWPSILVLVNAWKGVGMGAVVYIAAIAGIDQEYYEAAVLDGASKWQQIRHITIPSITPVIIILAILSMGNVFEADFGLFYQVTLDTGALYPVTDVVDTYIYRAMIELGDLGVSSAVSLVQSALGFVLVLLTNYAVRRINSDNALF